MFSAERNELCLRENVRVNPCRVTHERRDFRIHSVVKAQHALRVGGFDLLPGSLNLTVQPKVVRRTSLVVQPQGVAERLSDVAGVLDAFSDDERILQRESSSGPCYNEKKKAKISARAHKKNKGSGVTCRKHPRGGATRRQGARSAPTSRRRTRAWGHRSRRIPSILLRERLRSTPGSLGGSPEGKYRHQRVTFGGRETSQRTV